jgi:hypothetical protein
MAKSNKVIRRTMNGTSSYLVPRANVTGDSVLGKYRFAKIRKSDAQRFRPDDAQKILAIVSRRDTYAEEAVYHID